MSQCTAFTKAGTRCKKKSINKVCQYHQNYYENWIELHPPPLGWRLQLDEKPEYKFQIENGHVQITQEYVKSFTEPEQSDYYEYLLHLPHIEIDVNTKMLIYLFRSYLIQYESIQLNLPNLYQYFGNMFQNPSFNPATFIMRMAFVMDERHLRPSLLLPLRESRIREVFSVLLDCSEFSGIYYMNWKERMVEKLPKSKHLTIFLELLNDRKEKWFEKLALKTSDIKQEIQEFAMTPERVFDWYIDSEQKHQILSRFKQ